MLASSWFHGMVRVQEPKAVLKCCASATFVVCLSGMFAETLDVCLVLAFGEI